MDINPLLLSRYADGEVTPEETAAVERALASDETLAAEFEDLKTLGELFGHIEGEEVSAELEERLCALRPVEELASFEPVPASPLRRRASWTSWAAAAAALVLCAVGVRTLTHRPEVVLKDFTRLTLLPNGRIAQANRHAEVTRRAGDTLATKPSERLSFRTDDGSMVVLLPGSRLELGDAGAGELLELANGTVLCNVRDGSEPRRVRAAGFVIRADDADFGVRVTGAAVKTAGAGAGRRAQVTVTVSRGSVQVDENGSRETVDEFRRLVWRHGEPAKTSHAAEDPAYLALMRSPFRPHSREVVPGYFTGERGVSVIGRRRWQSVLDGARVLVLTDGGREAHGAKYLVLWARASQKTRLLATRIRPDPERPGTAQTVTVNTPEIGTEWTVVAVPLGAFQAPDAETGTIKIPAGRGRLLRLELKPAEPKIEFELRSSLWAERPPADHPEVVR